MVAPIVVYLSKAGAETMYSLMQFENLVEFDMSGVTIPAELQSQLQVTFSWVYGLNRGEV